jgi:hypothetical protein
MMVMIGKHSLVYFKYISLYKNRKIKMKNRIITEYPKEGGKINCLKQKK